MSSTTSTTSSDRLQPPSSPSARRKFGFVEPPPPATLIVSRRQSSSWIVVQTNRHVPLRVLYTTHYQQRPSSAAKQLVSATKVRVRRAAAYNNFKSIPAAQFFTNLREFARGVISTRPPPSPLAPLSYSNAKSLVKANKPHHFATFASKDFRLHLTTCCATEKLETGSPSSSSVSSTSTSILNSSINSQVSR